MTDVAEILGLGGSNNRTTAVENVGSVGATSASKAIQRLTGRSREVMGLFDSLSDGDPTTAPLPPVVPTFSQGGLAKSKILASANEPGSVKVGNRWIKIQSPARRWAWAPFSSSSRTDGTLFHHWVRSGVEYPDYPYARFDIHLDPVTYSDEEYSKFLKSDLFTKSETDTLMELVRRLELRWPVIYDRWIEENLSMNNTSESNASVKEFKIEDLQFRYYQVAALLNQARISQEAAAEAQMLDNAIPDPTDPEQKVALDHLLYETVAARQLATVDPSQQPLINSLASGTSNKVFDLHFEKDRRKFLEVQWNRTHEEELEEAALRKELKQIEARLRKMKKSGAHILQARKLGMASSGGNVGSTASSRNPSRSVSPVPGISVAGGPISGTVAGKMAAEPLSKAELDAVFASTAPVTMPGTPYLQSARLSPPPSGGIAGLNKTLLTRMNAVLNELRIPTRPLPTQRNCDVYDALRKDIITLLILQKNVLQKEGLLQKKRMGIDKLLANGNPVAKSNGKPFITEETVMGTTPRPQDTMAVAPNKTKTAVKSTSKAAPNTGIGGGKKGPVKAAGGKKVSATVNAIVSINDKPQDHNQKPVVAGTGSEKFSNAKGVQKPALGKSSGAGIKPLGASKLGGTHVAKKAAPKRKRKTEPNKSPVPSEAGMETETPAKNSVKKRKKTTTASLTTDQDAPLSP